MRPTITGYLRALALACIEASRRPELLGVPVGILRIAPRTIVELIGD
jgi:hypothetical protein